MPRIFWECYRPLQGKARLDAERAPRSDQWLNPNCPQEARWESAPKPSFCSNHATDSPDDRASKRNTPWTARPWTWPIHSLRTEGQTEPTLRRPKTRSCKPYLDSRVLRCVSQFKDSATGYILRNSAAKALTATLRASILRWAAIIAPVSLQAFDSLFSDDGNHPERRRRIGPPQTEKGVEQQPGQ